MTHYETLSIPVTATAREVQLAYRKLALATHPDRNPDDPGAAERFRNIAAAYEVLGNEQRRAGYDAVVNIGLASFNSVWEAATAGEALDILEQMNELLKRARKERASANQSASSVAWDAGDRFVNPDGFFLASSYPAPPPMRLLTPQTSR